MKSSADEDEPQNQLTLARLHDSLNFLITESIPKVQTFRPKWSLITTKLTTLLNLLSQLFNIPIHNRSSLSADVLRSISATLSSAESLSAVCSLAAPPSGKLRTQNYVDSLYAALDGLINDLEVIRKSGDENASPVLSGRRESVRTEARNLMTRLQIGSNDSKNSTLELLLGLLQEDDKNVVIAVSQGIVPVLVRLLDSSSSSEVKEKTVAAIARIATIHSSKHALLTEGLVLLNNMLRVLESGSIFAKEKSDGLVFQPMVHHHKCRRNKLQVVFHVQRRADIYGG